MTTKEEVAEEMDLSEEDLMEMTMTMTKTMKTKMKMKRMRSKSLMKL